MKKNHVTFKLKQSNVTGTSEASMYYHHQATQQSSQNHSDTFHTSMLTYKHIDLTSKHGYAKGVKALLR